MLLVLQAHHEFGKDLFGVGELMEVSLVVVLEFLVGLLQHLKVALPVLLHWLLDVWKQLLTHWLIDFNFLDYWLLLSFRSRQFKVVGVPQTSAYRG